MAIDRKTLLQLRKAARRAFDGSDRLFRACWRDVLVHLSDGGLCEHERRTGTFGMGCLGDISEALDQFASERVNNPRSTFYICG